MHRLEDGLRAYLPGVALLVERLRERTRRAQVGRDRPVPWRAIAMAGGAVGVVALAAALPMLGPGVPRLPAAPAVDAADGPPVPETPASAIPTDNPASVAGVPDGRAAAPADVGVALRPARRPRPRRRPRSRRPAKRGGGAAPQIASANTGGAGLDLSGFGSRPRDRSRRDRSPPTPGGGSSGGSRRSRGGPPSFTRPPPPPASRPAPPQPPPPAPPARRSPPAPAGPATPATGGGEFVP